MQNNREPLRNNLYLSLFYDHLSLLSYSLYYLCNILLLRKINFYEERILNKTLTYKEVTPEVMSVNNTNKIKQSEVVLNSNHKVELVTTNEGFKALRDDWCLLNKNASKGNIFTTWEWLQSWWEVYKDNGRRQLYIIKYIDNNDKLIGLAPFQIVNNPKKYFPCSRQLIMLGAGEVGGSTIMG